ncbi:G protein-coupled receptor, rhodopsin-like family and GPCR, rhodopsin-like, 7TM domain-containing protein [Strongyloides ratti]|uniref:G protein-coupled receptor, rhodopsin-like family and GPCR, rhodopsin-like, 7TM domain-containing protein n=1 Tax=Strongyloides ratti TaxID=34506 RepID=A0A090L406_STRRB|nr:G protein-coupled receptor, rhodopsin-like family and GPCR, rhodopsin-like, 7TM domain-containing protein [Strongyloides ratti]CEF62837.1 G protein-coupled receptor, rhodopsin-like family and GPCR, rhodopsin-like, 7TM domain-containing protein [Strongyloides ratti]
MSTITYNIRMIISIVQLILVFLGLANILIILVVLIRPYMRSITNVYIVSLCLADFIYLSNLVLVVSTQYNNREWPFGEFLCTTYHGTETTGKFASVLFVVLLAGDRYFAMCLSHLCSRYRTYKLAITASIIAWIIAFLAASPLYMYATVIQMKNYNGNIRTLCIAKWPYQALSHYYVGILTILIYIIPLILIVYFYYHIIHKLREAVKSSKRLKRASKTRASYHRVTRLVLWVVIFHVISWSPFWMYNIVNSIFKLRPTSHFDRIFANIIHLCPYINCALNPFLYAAAAENFQTAFKSLICINGIGKRLSIFENDKNVLTNALATSVVPKTSEYHKLPAALIPQSVLVFTPNNVKEGGSVTRTQFKKNDNVMENISNNMVTQSLTIPVVQFNLSSSSTSIFPLDEIDSNTKDIPLVIHNTTFFNGKNSPNDSKKIIFNDCVVEHYDNVTENDVNEDTLSYEDESETLETLINPSTENENKINIDCYQKSKNSLKIEEEKNNMICNEENDNDFNGDTSFHEDDIII